MIIMDHYLLDFTVIKLPIRRCVTLDSKVSKLESNKPDNWLYHLVQPLKTCVTLKFT